MTALVPPFVIFDEYTPVPRFPVPAHGEKGLHNFVGQNNCFLNVNIQALWHLKAWREEFLRYEKTHAHQSPENCIFCALKVILTEYQYGEDAHLPPTSMRLALSVIYKDLERFQLGKIDDASEALEATLACLHHNLTGDTKSVLSPERNQRCDPPCLAHKLFGLDLVEQVRCSSCGATSDFSPSTLFIAYTYAAALREQRARHANASFCEYLHLATEDDLRCCPNREKCKAMCPIYRFLVRAPAVFALGMVWDTPNSSAQDIATVLDMISLRIDLSNIFTMTNQRYMYQFRGMICYYGLHYSAFFWNSELRQWFSFDDMNVKEVGAEWAVIRDKCIRGRMQPSVLFYEREPTPPVPRPPMPAAPLSDTLAATSSSAASPQPAAGGTPATSQPTAPFFPAPEQTTASAATAIGAGNGTGAHANGTAPASHPVATGTAPTVSTNGSAHAGGAIVDAPSTTSSVGTVASTASGSLSPPLHDSAFLGSLSPAKIGAVGSTNLLHSVASGGIDPPQAPLLAGSLSPHLKRVSLDPAPVHQSPSIAAQLHQSAPAPEHPAANGTGTEPKKENGTDGTDTAVGMEESFVMLNPEPEFIVLCNKGWMYRRQTRVLRFGPTQFMRVLPDECTVKESWDYADVEHVLLVAASQQVVIRFKSGKEPQYLSTDRAAELVKLLEERASKLTPPHTVTVERK